MSEARASGRRPNQGRVGTVVNGKWTIDARIGSGGMATVYSATHRNGHRAALKLLHAMLSRDESTRARFLREGYVANAVGHPGVARVEDDGVTEDGAAFLVLELLEGETLEARRVRLGGMLPVDSALEIADSALDVLAMAHEKGIIHRDVKPDNVFITSKKEVKLLDFGLARMKQLQAEETKTGVTIGTPEFMAPEQAQGRRDDVDARSDVWAVGAMMFTCITGKNVHDAPTLHEQLMAAATQRPRPIRELAAHVPAAVAIVIDRALELERADRWSSAREMQRALRAARAAKKSGTERFFVDDALTMPSASPPSMAAAARDAAARDAAARDATAHHQAEASDHTLLAVAPSSESTIEVIPISVYLDELPTSVSAVAPTARAAAAARPPAAAPAERPQTQRLSVISQIPQTPVPVHRTAPMAEPSNAAASAASAAPAAKADLTSTADMGGDVGANARADRTLAVPGAPSSSSASYPYLSASGPSAMVSSGAYPLLGSGAYPTNTSGAYPLNSSGAFGAADPLAGSGGYPHLPSGVPSGYLPNGHLASGHLTSAQAANGPVPPQADSARDGSGSGAVPRSHIQTLRGHAEPAPSSPRAAIIVSVLLILLCAGAGAWVLLHPNLVALLRH